MAARALHYVFKVANRAKTIDFYTNVLDMKVLRHEEFDKGCEASCNGPYDERWSKTMIGYGPEDDHFVIELTYNYPIHKYELGNDYRAIVIDSDELFDKISKIDHRKSGCGRLAVKDPDGHEFKIGKAEHSPKVIRVQVNVGNLEKSKEYWNGVLGMPIVEEKSSRIILSFGKDQCGWEIVQSKDPINRGSAFGRIAFSYPGDKLKSLQDKVKSANGKIINELLTLETPGKADVQVVILADPDEHEICFVGDEGFRALSKVDEAAEKELRKQIEKDDSEKWDRFPLENCPTLVKLGVFKHFSPIKLLFSSILNKEDRELINRMGLSVFLNIESSRECMKITLIMDDNNESTILIPHTYYSLHFFNSEVTLLPFEVQTVLHQICSTFKFVELKTLFLVVYDDFHHDELLNALSIFKSDGELKVEIFELFAPTNDAISLGGNVSQFLKEIVCTGKFLVAVALESVPNVLFAKKFIQVAPSVQLPNIHELKSQEISICNSSHQIIHEFLLRWKSMELETKYVRVQGEFHPGQILRGVNPVPKWITLHGDDEILGFEVHRRDGSMGIVLLNDGFTFVNGCLL